MKIIRTFFLKIPKKRHFTFFWVVAHVFSNTASESASRHSSYLAFYPTSLGIAKSVGCFQRRLFVCQHDNFRTSKHRMMKLGGKCIVQKSRPRSNLGVMGADPQICDVGLRRWKNQRRMYSSVPVWT